MANPTVDNGGLTDYPVASDDDGSGNNVQLVKLVQSAIDQRDAIAADADGLEVKLTNASLAITHAALTELAAAIDTELQVDVVGALPVGDNNIGNVDVASSALPTGAATSAKQDAAQTALDAIKTSVELLDNAISGTEMQVDVVSMPTVTVDGSGVTQPVSHGALTELAAAIDTEVQVDVVGALPAGNNNIGDVDVASSALPTGAATSAKQDTVIGHLDGVEGLLTTIDADTGGILTSVQTLDNAISGSEMQVDVVAALPAGTNNIGDVDIASITTPTSGGYDIFRSLDVDETEEEIKGTAGQVFGWYLYNDGAAEVYVKFYNATAANVTVGTTTPVLTIPIPAGSAANVEFMRGIAFGTAITIAATTGVADNDTTAPAANQVVGNILYK